MSGTGAPSAGQPTSTEQADPVEIGEGDVVRVNTTLITVPVSVMDRAGKYIPDLVKEDFHLWEDGVEQRLAYFGSVEQPFTVALVIDTSASTRYRIEEIQDAAISFVDQLRPGDRVMVVSFDDKIRVLSEPTDDRSQLRFAIRQTRTGGGTKLYDAMDLVMNQKLSRIKGRKAIVLFTDGVDTTSKNATFASTIRDAEELDALVYPVQYDTYSDAGGVYGTSLPLPRRSRPSIFDILVDIIVSLPNGGGGGPTMGGSGTSRADYELANQYLTELAEKTGARKYDAGGYTNLSQAFAMVAEELRIQYSLGYYPKNPVHAGDRRRIRVRVDRPNLAVRAKDSYVFKPNSNVQNNQQSTPVLKNPLLADSTEPDFE
jgi:VWFA-related protein